MNSTFISLRFEQIDKRFREIDVLLRLAVEHERDTEVYQTLCRSAHVLLVSHFEGLYKDVCKDVIDDLNRYTKFYEIKKPIFNTHCNLFIQATESKAIYSMQLKLWEAFKDHPTKLKSESFLFVDNKNPAPKIIETILERFGKKDFFWSINGSELDVAFQDQKNKTQRVLSRLVRYVKSNTIVYPYTVDSSFYRPVVKADQPKTDTLWHAFLDSLLVGRHNIVHGHILDNPTDHNALLDAKIKIEILLYAFIINVCSSANPLFLLPEHINDDWNDIAE